MLGGRHKIWVYIPGLLRTTINKLKQDRSITPKLTFIQGGQDDATVFENYLIEEQDVDGKKVGLVRSSGLPLRRFIELMLLMMMLIMPKILMRIIVKVLKTLLKDEVISKARIYSNEVEILLMQGRILFSSIKRNNYSL
ncbi:uncharacterized protein [Aristolochia californica]|uniref:uncharacterized protein isoform X3 n=1 Tax=Aristolochia californica TaxID=171875 RepID=UPI0035DCF7F0